MDAQLEMVFSERKKTALEAIVDNASDFRADFPAWIEDNWPIWLKFEDIALETARKREHYSVKTVWEVIRHHTMLSERGSEFKLNNNFTADCARLFHLLHPHHNRFFDLRVRRAATVAEEVA